MGRHCDDKAISPVGRPCAPQPKLRVLSISAIRQDGGTQHRSGIDAKIMGEYAGLMKDGFTFPPVRVWWDGTDYWLSDGFHRIAAAQQAGMVEIEAEIYFGALEDAQWDSYSSNSAHGIRRTQSDTQQIIRRALEHPNARVLSNVEIAKHLSIPEATVRRWRRKLDPGGDETVSRIVTRGGTQYVLNAQNIGKRRCEPLVKARSDLHSEMERMKTEGSPKVRPLLNVIANWALGSATPTACLASIERIAQRWNLDDCDQHLDEVGLNQNASRAATGPSHR